MSLIFKKISFKNFLSFGNNITTIELDNQLSTLIYGINGSGKTTIMEAIYYNLIGKPFRDIKKDELINTANQKELYTELSLEFNKDKYLIKRGMKPNIFEIEKNGKLVEMDASIKDYQKVVNNLIGVDAKTFSDTIFISSKNYTPFMTLKASDKRNFIENVFGLKEFSAISDELKIDRSLTTNRVSDLHKDIDHQTSLLEMGQETNEKTSSNNSVLIDETKADIAEEKKQGKKASTETNKINKWLIESDVKKEILIIENNIINFNNDISKHKTLVSQSEIELRRLFKEQEFFTNNSSCPQCKQSLDKSSNFLKKYLKELKQEIVCNQSNIIENADEIGRLETLMDEKVEERNKLNVNYSKASSRLLELGNNISNHIRNIKRLEATLIKLNEKNTDELIDVLTFENKIKEFNLDLTEKDTKLENIKTLIQMMSDKGIKSFVISKYLPTVNQLANKWLGLFNADYRIKFDSLFNISIIARGYEKLSYGSFSSGETQRVDLALLFAFHEISVMKNSMNMSILLLDEISDKSLDTAGLEGLLMAFEFFKSKGISIFNITHRPEIKDRFDRSIKVYKEKFSKIELQ